MDRRGEPAGMGFSPPLAKAPRPLQQIAQCRHRLVEFAGKHHRLDIGNQRERSGDLGFGDIVERDGLLQ
jgi:hypothetical protein